MDGKQHSKHTFFRPQGRIITPILDVTEILDRVVSVCLPSSYNIYV